MPKEFAEIEALYQNVATKIKESKEVEAIDWLMAAEYEFDLYEAGLKNRYFTTDSTEEKKKVDAERAHALNTSLRLIFEACLAHSQSKNYTALREACETALQLMLTGKLDPSWGFIKDNDLTLSIKNMLDKINDQLVASDQTHHECLLALSAAANYQRSYYPPYSNTFLDTAYIHINQCNNDNDVRLRCKSRYSMANGRAYGRYGDERKIHLNLHCNQQALSLMEQIKEKTLDDYALQLICACLTLTLKQYTYFQAYLLNLNPDITISDLIERARYFVKLLSYNDNSDLKILLSCLLDKSNNNREIELHTIFRYLREYMQNNVTQYLVAEANEEDKDWHEIANNCKKALAYNNEIPDEHREIDDLSAQAWIVRQLQRSFWHFAEDARDDNNLVQAAQYYQLAYRYNDDIPLIEYNDRDSDNLAIFLRAFWEVSLLHAKAEAQKNKWMQPAEKFSVFFETDNNTPVCVCTYESQPRVSAPKKSESSLVTNDGTNKRSQPDQAWRLLTGIISPPDAKKPKIAPSVETANSPPAP